MTQTLSAAVDWKSLCSSPGSFTLITETGLADAGFLLSYAVSEHLNRGYRDGTSTVACFVAIAQTGEHYQQVGLKLGVNLSRCEEQGRLAFVDGLRSTGELLLRSTKTSSVAADDDQHVPCLFNHEAGEQHADGLRHLYFQIKSAVHRVTSNGTAKCLLVVDDLSVLLYIGIPVKEVVGFVEYCRRLTSSVGASLIVLTHGSIPRTPPAGGNSDDEDDEEKTRLCNFLAHRSDTIFGVTNLVSGYSKDISGEMVMLHRRISGDAVNESSGSSFKRWHFKVEDKRIVVFAPGLSPAVL